MSGSGRSGRAPNIVKTFRKRTTRTVFFGCLNAGKVYAKLNHFFETAKCRRPETSRQKLHERAETAGITENNGRETGVIFSQKAGGCI